MFGASVIINQSEFYKLFILIAPYEIVKDNSLPFIGAFLGSYAHYRKKDKNEDFTTKERLIGVCIVFILSIVYFS